MCTELIGQSIEVMLNVFSQVLIQPFNRCLFTQEHGAIHAVIFLCCQMCFVILYFIYKENAVWFCVNISLKGMKVHSHRSVKRSELLLKDFKLNGLCLHPSSSWH